MNKCKKCDKPETMYFCEECDSNSDTESCELCGNYTIVDTDYHKNHNK